MVAEQRSCEIDISEYYLRLTTESIRLFSNKIQALQSFGEVVDYRAGEASSLADHYSGEDMREHLAIIPTEGEIPIRFTILETSAASIDDAAAMLQEALGTSIAFADALSLLMYDFVVEENKTEVLTKLGLTAEAAERYRKIMKRTSSNVVPFR